MLELQTIRQSGMEASKVGKRGSVVVPARLRRKFGIEEGTLVIAEEREDGILLRPAVGLPLEVYCRAQSRIPSLQRGRRERLRGRSERG
jgi:AbrB family looped-hinge helix DNA binding protein